MLLVHPVNEVVRLLPVLLISLVLGSRTGNHLWGLVAVAVLVIFALLRWFTTSYRLGPVHVQLRSGIFQKKLLSVPRNRIRSVDVEAGVLHRMLGLSVVRVGTGLRTGRPGESSKFELNALDSRLVPALRVALLARHLDAQTLDERESATPQSAGPPEAPEVEIAHWSPRWVRYAPFSVTGVLTVLTLVGVAFQYGVGEQIARSSAVSRGLDSAQRLGTTAAVLAGLFLLLALASALACVRYLVAFSNLRVTDDGHVLHVSHGLLKTRQSTLDRTRLRGTTLHEPLLLRLAHGARLDAIMTGVAVERRHSSMLLPQAPHAEATRMMGIVLREQHFPTDVTGPLTEHGPRARRRRYTRALLPVAVLAAADAVAAAFGASTGWPAVVVLVLLAGFAAALAHDRYRGLGHATPPGWLVTSSGSLDRGRHSLEADGIVGWTVRQTFFQRRAGVATIVAATPAGTGHYEVIDLPVERAWGLVESVAPGAGDIWSTTT
ncbi:PH domain-containing protein [Rhodococcus spelaei]|uniref:PH domain-containing protein n=1 Tax=Rhodococcus spelaei TaxID=2546320 RepID=A0A541BPP4_9NOCA|nr:PH domain-containing protein [Rhodococcus spelaei]TQF74314.1 PH domain-containing protein [Rhodococcus spelaei]